MTAAIGIGGSGEGLTLSSHVDEDILFDKESVAYDLLIRLLHTDSGIKHEKHVATAMDLRTLAAGLDDKQLLRVAAIQLRVPVEDLDTNNPAEGRRANIEANYRRLNSALMHSSDFIRNELKLPLPADIANTRVNSSADIISLLSKTTVFRKGQGGLDRHLAYCALVKGALAAIELETRYANELAGEANYLQSVITSPRPENNNIPLVIEKPFSSSGEETSGTLSVVGNPPCDVMFQIRDKTWQSIMRKFMSKPEATAKEAHKDEIAFRFKLDGRRMGTVSRILGFFKKQFEAGARMITNKGVMSQSEFDELFKSLSEIRGSRGLAVDPKSNPKSDPSFAVLQINGTMKVPPGGDQRVSKKKWRDRSFEIQFVDEARKPPTGLASDAVYALKKDIVIATRLFGGFEKKWLLDHAVSASLDTKYTNMSTTDILNGLIAQGYIFKKPGTRDKYAATDVWDNWLHIGGLVTNEKMRKKLSFSVEQALQQKELGKKKKANVVE